MEKIYRVIKKAWLVAAIGCVIGAVVFGAWHQLFICAICFLMYLIIDDIEKEKEEEEPEDPNDEL